MDQDAPPVFGGTAMDSVEKTHRDALALAVSAQAFIADGRAADGLSSTAQTVYAAETLRMTSRITHVVAWTLNRKALDAGEIDAEAAATDERRLGGAEVCLAAPAGDIRILPEPLRALLEDSRRLYERARRLERMLVEKASAANASPVRALWQRLEGLDS